MYGEHICRAGSSYLCEKQFFAGGPAARDAHVFYVRFTPNVRGEHICRTGSSYKCVKQFFRRQAGGP